jgi:phosphatidylserine/phosphatidylglycerophosphate/cardiolipin synthase-like enzyme
MWYNTNNTVIREGEKMEGISLLNTNELNDEIKKMFSEEKKRLIIVSPFNFIDDRLINILSKSSASIHFLYKKPKDSEKGRMDYIKDKLSKINYIDIENLHAKAYISNKYSIITSLNLIASSQRDNYEFGIMFENSCFDDLYNKLINEIKSILKEENKENKVFLEKKKFLPIEEYNRNRQSGRKVYNMKYLYRDIMEKNDKDWTTDDQNDEIYKRICNNICQKFSSFFKDNDYYQDHSALIRQTEINKEIYSYGIENIKI